MRTWAEQRKLEQDFIERTRREWVEELKAEFQSAPEAAEANGMNRGQLAKILRALEVDFPSRKQPAKNTGTAPRVRSPKVIEREKRARVLAAKGYTLKQAADDLGITKTGVIGIEKRLGLEFVREQRNSAPPSNAKPKARRVVPDKPVTFADFAAIESERMRAVLRGRA